MYSGIQNSFRAVGVIEVSTYVMFFPSLKIKCTNAFVFNASGSIIGDLKKEPHSGTDHMYPWTWNDNVIFVCSENLLSIILGLLFRVDLNSVPFVSNAGAWGVLYRGVSYTDDSFSGFACVWLGLS